MTEEKLNELKNYFKDKKVLLVGNSSDLMNSPPEVAETIDKKYDIVLRFGAGVPNTEERIKRIGKRTNIWAFGCMRSKHHGWFQHADYFFYIYGSIKKGPYEHMKEKYSGDNPSLPELVEINSREEREQFIKDSGIKRPSTGNLMVNFLVNKIGTYKKLSLIGFDFFSCEAPKINGKKGSKSFHKTTKAYDVHKGGVEKEWTMKLKRKGKLKILKFKAQDLD